MLGEQLDVGVQRLADDGDVTLQPINLGAERVPDSVYDLISH